MYKICFFVPKAEKEVVKNAMFLVGAGRIGNYDSCSFETLGLGQFKPLEGSNPFKGDQDKLELVEEYKVEMVCEAQYIEDVISAMKKKSSL